MQLSRRSFMGSPDSRHFKTSKASIKVVLPEPFCPYIPKTSDFIVKGSDARLHGKRISPEETFRKCLIAAVWIRTLKTDSSFHSTGSSIIPAFFRILNRNLRKVIYYTDFVFSTRCDKNSEYSRMVIISSKSMIYIVFSTALTSLLGQGCFGFKNFFETMSPNDPFSTYE